jgi:hypothetical protein
MARADSWFLERTPAGHEATFLVMPTKVGIHDFGRPSPVKVRFLINLPSQTQFQ